MSELLTREQVADEALALQSDMSCSSELADAHKARVQNAADPSAAFRAMQPQLPQLPDARAAEVYDGVLHFERGLTSARRPGRFKPDERVPLRHYAKGCAYRDDQLSVFGCGPVLAEAGHATDMIRKDTGRLGPADHGTAGVAGLLALEGRACSIVAVGCQTSNTNSDPNHPIKRVIAVQLATRNYDGFLSVHGMRSGKIQHLLDQTELHGVVGLGLHPSNESWTAAEELCRRAAEYGLKVIIGNQHWHLDLQPDASENRRFPGVTNRLKLDENGRPVTARLAAYGEAFTTTFASQVTEGRAPVNMQLEISRRLRMQAEGHYRRPDRVAERMAIYLGYRLAEMAVEVSTEHATMQA